MDKIILSPLNRFINLCFKYMYLNHIAFSLEADQIYMSKSGVVKETATKSVNRMRNSKESLIFEI